MERIVLDTNIPLLDANNIVNMGGDDVIVVLPETVLSELDSKKNGFEEINYQARVVARLLDGAEIVNVVRTEDAIITELIVEGIRVDIVMLEEYEADASSYGGNDRRIIEVAKYLRDTYGNTRLVTNDIHMKFQSIACDVDTSALVVVGDSVAEFVKEFVVEDPEVFRTLHKANILDVDPGYELENYSYKFTCCNTNQMKLATIHNGFIEVLGKDTVDKLRLQEAAPMNTEQLFMSKAIQDPSTDIVVVEAKSGSGKTVSAISNAMRLMKTNKDKYQSIVYIRNSVDDIGEKDEEIGFLSGNEDKMAVYLHPLEDTLDFIARKRVKTKGMKVEEIEDKVAETVAGLRATYNVQGMIAMGLRGRTLHNSIVIIDEAQNIGTSTMQKIMTRVGKDSKLIVIGSQAQIDSSYLNARNNGLAVLLDECKNKTLVTDIGLFAINLHKVLRSPMSEFAEDLYTK